MAEGAFTTAIITRQNCTKIGVFGNEITEIDAFAIPYGPYLEISSIKGSIGVNVVINNIGPVNMTVYLGLLKSKVVFLG